MPDLAEEIIAEARSWIGTPYHHAASAKGVGTDCLGLIRGIWRALHGDEPEQVPDYAADWAEATGQETLLRGAHRHLLALEIDQASPGDAILFRLTRSGCAQHIGIQSQTQGAPTLIHAWSGHAVAEVSFDNRWQSRRAAAFRFPALPHPK